MTDLFEVASREKYRFPANLGANGLTAEQLWDLPLTSERKTSLDGVARMVNADLKAVTEESFVTTAASNPAKTVLETKLEIVKHIIAVRLAENEAKRAAADKASEKAKLLGILARKQDAGLETLSEDELRERIGAL